MNRTILLLLLSLLSTAAFTQADTTLLAPANFEKALLEKNGQLVDVRTPNEYGKGHIKNSLLFNWNQRDSFEVKAKSLDRAKPVYVYCAAGVRSKAAAEWLRSNGFARVYELAGGFNQWKEEKKPVQE